MKHLNLTILLAVLISLGGVKASAHDIEVKNTDGVTIYYKWTNNQTELSVSYKGDSSYDYSNEYSGDVVIPESVTYQGETYSVMTIGEDAFSDCSSLTSVIIPESVTSIGDYAFESCTGLTSVTIGNCVTSIGNGAFRECGGLTSVTIPNSVTSIGSKAFSECYWLASITIGNHVTSIGDGAFEFSRLTSITIPNSVTTIGNAAFYYCLYLNSVTIGNGVTSIGDEAFYYCSALTSITIPNSVTSIGDETFWCCSGLTSATIGNGVISIGDGAFLGCSKLQSIVIGSSVANIINNPLRECPKLAYIIVDNDNKNFDSRENCNAIIETNTNTLIVGCKNTTIPNSVTSIGNCAVEGCSGLTSVTIPEGVTSIGYSAFQNCSNLNVVYNKATTPQSLLYDAQFNYSTATLHVPVGTKSLYKASDYWKNFNNIVDDIPTAINNVNENKDFNLKVKSNFSIDGKSISQPQKGINIQKMSDGTGRKIVVQ